VSGRAGAPPLAWSEAVRILAVMAPGLLCNRHIAGNLHFNFRHALSRSC